MKRSVFSVLVDPGTGRLNGRAELRKRGPRYEIGTSDRYKGCKAAVASAARVAASRHRFDSGLLAFSMTFYCSSERHLENMPKWFELGNLDVDSPIKCVLDGLQAGGLVDDDARFIEGHVRKRVDRQRPRISVAVYEVDLFADAG